MQPQWLTLSRGGGGNACELNTLTTAKEDTTRGPLGNRPVALPTCECETYSLRPRMTALRELSRATRSNTQATSPLGLLKWKRTDQKVNSSLAPATFRGLHSHPGLTDSPDAEHLHFHSESYLSVLVSTPSYKRGRTAGSAARAGTWSRPCSA